jgi:hypothetical protein
MAKKKKSHGGLKFLAFVVVVVGLIVSISKGVGTETGQRIVGHREDRRVERTALTPRFGYSSAKMRITVQSMYNAEGSVVDLTSTRDVSLDRASSTVLREISVDRTPTEVSPGVEAIPYDALNAKYSQIVTKLYHYESPLEPGKPWTRTAVEPYYYGTELDDHFLPMVDDIMGYELRALPSTSPPSSSAVSGWKRVNTPTLPSDVAAAYTYEFDFATYRRVAPILANRTLIEAPPEAVVTLTIAFDKFGLLRFADVAVADSVATTVAQERGDGGSGAYHYTLDVTEISGEPIKIDLPTDVVDEDPAEIEPGTVI